MGEAIAAGVFSEEQMWPVVQQLEQRISTRADPKSKAQCIVWEIVYEGPIPTRISTQLAHRSFSSRQLTDLVELDVLYPHYVFVDDDEQHLAEHLEKVFRQCQEVLVCL